MSTILAAFAPGDDPLNMAKARTRSETPTRSSTRDLTRAKLLTNCSLKTRNLRLNGSQ
jgi:hypothetical protein